MKLFNSKKADLVFDLMMWAIVVPSIIATIVIAS